MTTNKSLKINNIVDFLERKDKNSLEDLISRFPQFRKELKGITLNTESPGLDELRFRVEVSRSGLQSIYTQSEKAFITLKTRLKKLNSIQLLSQVIIIISGATILSTIQQNLGDQYNVFKFVAPSLVLVGSILTLIAKNKSESFLTGNENLYEITSKLISYKSEAKNLLRELEILTSYFSSERASIIIEKANKLASEMDITIEKI